MLSGKSIEFMLRDDSLQYLDDIEILHQRLLWVYQYKLQWQVASTVIKCDGSPSKPILTMLRSTGDQEAKASQYTPDNAIDF